MNQELQPLFNLDAVKVAVGNTPDPEVATLPKRRRRYVSGFVEEPKEPLTSFKLNNSRCLTRSIQRGRRGASLRL